MGQDDRPLAVLQPGPEPPVAGRQCVARRDRTNHPGPCQQAYTRYVALEKSGDLLNNVGTVYGVYTNNMLTPEFRAVQQEWNHKLSAASDKITLNPKLFARIEALYNQRNSLGLDAKQMRLLERQ